MSDRFHNPVCRYEKQFYTNEIDNKLRSIAEDLGPMEKRTYRPNGSLTVYTIRKSSDGRIEILFDSGW